MLLHVFNARSSPAKEQWSFPPFPCDNIGPDLAASRARLVGEHEKPKPSPTGCSVCECLMDTKPDLAPQELLLPSLL